MTRLEERAMASAGLPVFEKFVADLRAIWQAESENQARMEMAKPLLERLVQDASLKAHSARWANCGATPPLIEREPKANTLWAG